MRAAQVLGLDCVGEGEGEGVDDGDLDVQALSCRAADKALAAAADTAANTSSMLTDVKRSVSAGRGRAHEPATEAAYLNGYIAREGAALGAPAPVNEFLAGAVEAIALTLATANSENTK